MTTDSDSKCSYVANLADFNVIREIIIVIVIKKVYNSNKNNYSNSNSYSNTYSNKSNNSNNDSNNSNFSLCKLRNNLLILLIYKVRFKVFLIIN